MRRHVAAADPTAASDTDFPVVIFTTMDFPAMDSMITDSTMAISTAAIFMAFPTTPVTTAAAATGLGTISGTGVALEITTISVTGSPVSGICRPASAATIMDRATTAFGAAEGLNLSRLGERLEKFECLRHRA